MTDETKSVPDTPEGLAEWIDGLTFHLDQPVADEDLPPLLDENEDALVPRSFKIPQRLDAALQRIADTRRPPVSKSELIRQYLEAGVAAEVAAEGEEVFIRLADALRALTGLRHLPRSA